MCISYLLSVKFSLLTHRIYPSTWYMPLYVWLTWDLLADARSSSFLRLHLAVTSSFGSCSFCIPGDSVLHSPFHIRICSMAILRGQSESDRGLASSVLFLAALWWWLHFCLRSRCRGQARIWFACFLCSWYVVMVLQFLRLAISFAIVLLQPFLCVLRVLISAVYACVAVLGSGLLRLFWLLRLPVHYPQCLSVLGSISFRFVDVHGR